MPDGVSPGKAASFVKRRHEGTVNTITLLSEVTERPDMLEARVCSAEQGQSVVDREGSVIGAGRPRWGQPTRAGGPVGPRSGGGLSAEVSLPFPCATFA